MFFCLFRILHMISAIWSKWITKRILIGKTDLDTTYFRIHANKTTELICIVIAEEPAFLFLRLPFGTTPTPAEYATISEAAIDLGNNLLQDGSWDTDDLNSLHRSLLQHKEIQNPASHLTMSDSSEVNITATEASMDGFIYDIITIKVDDKKLDRSRKKCSSIGHP